MKQNVSIVLIGIGGYGDLYVQAILEQKYNATLVGVVDIHPEKCPHYQQLIERHIPIFSSIEAFYKNSNADLAIISTPIHLHTSHTCYALEHGSHVLCEKPISPTVQDARKIIETQKTTGKYVAIGFNWSFTSSIQQLKQDIMEGAFGKAQQLKTIVLWPRNHSYFTRAPWAGRKWSNKGELILDSVASNATAHFLHNMFYLLGEDSNKSAPLKTVTAELYRANAIENFDTCAARIFTQDDVEVLFYASHAVTELLEPTFVYEFEKATLTYSKGETITACFHNGDKKVYSDPEQQHFQKLPACIEAVSSGRATALCGPEAAYSHILSINGMQDSVPDITTFPQNQIKDDNGELTWVQGLSESFREAYNQGVLPSEMNVSWANKGKTITLTNYKEYNG
ncbi:putative dehydrogenase [Pullulanibacillus pueri]|uniref:Oxidoreductase n=1 Tax=Pullulanibacillus pueri TaxID=1437324 RepID=A0A8J2ZYF5_9BACL|nr:Gfo/Idh/MocA family oxidoreductase [Pullulanibacillus pueri]MBM7682991.1 putative dehydrogenase [Pullulanibacillus pueri]GGH85934.1 oxidoreductase [Pullulanibacillus pueri]